MESQQQQQVTEKPSMKPMYQSEISQMMFVFGEVSGRKKYCIN